jgi:hypothetical protein
MNQLMLKGEAGERIMNTKGKRYYLEKIADLRSSHFPLGYDEASYITEQ